MISLGCDPHCLQCTTEGPGKCDPLQCIGDYFIVYGKQTCAGEERKLADNICIIYYIYFLMMGNPRIGDENTYEAFVQNHISDVDEDRKLLILKAK